MRRIRRLTAQLAVAAVAIALIPGTTGAEPAWAGPETSRITAELNRMLDTGTADTGGKALAALSAPELLDLGRKKFAALVDKSGDFSDLAGAGAKEGNVFTALPATRGELNDFAHNAKFRDLRGVEALDGVEALQWIVDLTGAFDSDLSKLQQAEIFAGQVPVLAEALGLANAIVSGDDIDVAQNVVTLLANSAGFAVSFASPVVAVVIVLVGALIGAFIATFKDTSPIQFDYMKDIRDRRFQEWLPNHIDELTTSMSAAAAEMFAAWQATEVFNLGLVDAAIDRAALAAEVADPKLGGAVVAKAATQKWHAHAALQAKLAADREAFIAQSTDGFAAAVTKAIADPEMVKKITNEVFPLSSATIGSLVYGTSSQDGRLGSDSNWATLFPEGDGATWPWAAAEGSTGGWDMFAADAAAVESKRFPFLPREQPYCYAGGRDGAFYADQSVEWLNQYCYSTLTRMAERYGSIVQELRGTALPTVGADQLKSLFTQHLNDPEIQKALTVMTLPIASIPGS